MIASSHPAFAKLGPKLERAARELQNLDAFLAQYDALPPEAVNAWGRMTAIAAAIQNVYNGIEDTLLSLANDVDGSVPTGETSHQDLLDQMRAAVVGLRPPLLDWIAPSLAIPVSLPGRIPHEPSALTRPAPLP